MTQPTNKRLVTEAALATALTPKVTANSPITGATKTKVTYDAKGLVTAGADATQDDIGDGTTYKQFSATEKTKLSGIATGATANSSDATLLNRANHTGSQAESTITNLVSDLASKVGKGTIVFNVKDYGALGDGTTTDTTSIASAFTAARSASVSSKLVEVVFPPGNYIVDASLNPGLCRIVGYGATLTVKNGSTSFNVLASTTQEFSVSGLTIDLNKANVTYSGSLSNGIGVYSFRAAGGSLGAYRDLTIKNGYCPGIRIGATVATDAYDAPRIEALIENCVIDTCEYGVWCQGGAGAKITKNKVINCGTAGIWDNNSRDTVITHNYVNGTTGTNSSCITTSYSYACTIGFNDTYASKFAGITVGGGSATWTAARYFRIFSNHCEGHYNHGITVDPTISGALNTSVYSGGSIVGNTCRHNGWTPSYGNGIYINNGSTISITGNMCEDNYSSGIALNGQRLAVAGNTCVENGLYGIELRILVDSASDHNTYRVGGNNVCYNNGDNIDTIHPKYDIYTQPYVTDSPVDLSGTGSPEGVYTGCVGSTYRRTDGTTANIMYTKVSGSGNTGWVAKDSVNFTGFTPPSGSWQQPSNFMNSSGGMGVSQTIYWMPFDIGPNSMTLQGIAVNVNTALVGGTTTTTLALYQDDGTGGFPLLSSAGLLQSGTVLLTSTGKATLSSSLVLAPGRYWGAFLYNETSAPTTAAVLATYSNAAPALWLPNGFTLGSASRALTLTGQTSMPTTSQTLSISNTGQVVPVMGLRRA